jgi:SnoaL-like domain
MPRPTGLVFLAAAVLSAPSYATEPDQRVQRDIVEQYLQARAATMQQNASSVDVDRVLSLCLASVEYEHPRVGIRLQGIKSLRAGMLGFLGASRNASITITDSLQGRDMLAVRTRVSFEGQASGGWEPVQRSQVWVFELEGRKITRIIEYW